MGNVSQVTPPFDFVQFSNISLLTRMFNSKNWVGQESFSAKKTRFNRNSSQRREPFPPTLLHFSSKAFDIWPKMELALLLAFSFLTMTSIHSVYWKKCPVFLGTANMIYSRIQCILNGFRSFSRWRTTCNPLCCAYTCCNTTWKEPYT